MKVFYLCGDTISPLMLLGACAAPSQEAGISPAPVKNISDVAAKTTSATPTSTPTSAPEAQEGVRDDSPNATHANVVEVSARGSAGAYSISVTVGSPDTGCNQFADWWEALTEDGELIYRRVLAHSHTSEQPFTRSGGPVEVQPSEQVIVRAHMSTSGYGGLAMRGTVYGGFEHSELGDEFAPEVASLEPLPDSCAF